MISEIDEVINYFVGNIRPENILVDSGIGQGMLPDPFNTTWDSVRLRPSIFGVALNKITLSLLERFM